MAKQIARQPEGSTVVRVATTTSAYDTRLLDDKLKQPFYQYSLQPGQYPGGLWIEPIPLGSGAAINAGMTGAADVVLTHDYGLEMGFVNAGYSAKRNPFMYNHFVVVGPDSSLLEGVLAIDALYDIHGLMLEDSQWFVSRGDNSGTHNKELALWGILGITRADLIALPKYFQTGTGMAATLACANVINNGSAGFCLTDTGTWHVAQEAGAINNLNYSTDFEGDPNVINQYAVMAVSAAKVSGVNEAAAQMFVDFLISQEGQGLIGAFTVNDEPVFVPNAGAPDARKAARKAKSK